MRSEGLLSDVVMLSVPKATAAWPVGQTRRSGLLYRAMGSALLALAGHSSVAIAQCGPQWLPVGIGSYFNQDVLSVGGWDPDGSGPARPVVVVGGYFTEVGSVAAARIAMWDGVQWHPLGPGFEEDVLDIASHPDGRLVVGGRFIFSGTGSGPFECCVASWDGESWQRVGDGVNGTVPEVEVLPNGDILVAGQFTVAGGTPARRIATWNGTNWTEIGGGISNGSVEALGVLANGDIVAGGTFSGYLRAWNGSNWYNVGGSTPNGPLKWITANPSGGFDMCGTFTGIASTGVNGFARYDGTGWQGFGDGFNGGTLCSVLLPDGNVIVGGGFTTLPNAPDANHVAKWDGSAWVPLGDGLNRDVVGMHLTSSGELIVVGVFTSADGIPVQRFARWTETGIPWVAYQPADQALLVGDDLVLSATPATSYSNVVFQWKKNGVDIIGASGALASPTDGQAAHLVVEGVVPSDAGEYSVVFSNACGAVVSDSVGVSISGTCPADYNGAGDEGDVLDFLDFFDDFGACENQAAPCGSFGDADVNGDTGVDVLDFLDYLDAFGSGC